MFHVVLTRSRSGGRAVDRMEALRRVQKACAASGAAFMRVEDGRRFFVATSDGTEVRVYDPPPNRGRVKQSWSVLDATFNRASISVADFLLALSTELNCLSLIAGTGDPAAPELPLTWPGSSDPISGQEVLTFVEEHCRVPTRPGPPTLAAPETSKTNE